MQLPHKKVMILAAVCVSVIAITLAYKVSASNKAAQLSANGILGAAGESVADSLADQRIIEALNKARIDGLASASSTNPFAPDPKDSLSDRFAKNVFAAYQQSQGGNASDEQLAEDVVNGIDTSVMPTAKYTIADVSISGGSKGEVAAYGNNFAQAYILTAAPIVQNPELYNSNISAISRIYAKMATELLKVKVPNQLANTHLNLVNSFYLSSEYFLIIADQQKDPVKAVLALRMVGEMMAKQKELFTTIAGYFSTNGIIFEKGTPGEIWSNKEALGITGS